MPDRQALPEELVQLAYRQSVELTDARWESDCARLLDALDQILQSPEPEYPSDAQLEEAVPPQTGHRTARIYISSTRADLAEHRRAVYIGLRQLRHEVIAIEDYPMADARPLQKSVDDITHCEAVVFIVAWRYGYVPPDRTENPEGLSIVELEYREASRLGKPIFVFLAHEDAPSQPSFMDSATGEGEGGERISRFRNELLSERLVSFFRTPNDLTNLVFQAIADWKAGKGASTSVRVQLRVFLASPGDVSDERALARTVLDRLSQEYALRNCIHIEEVSWTIPARRCRWTPT